MKSLLVHNSATMRRILANALREIGCDEIIESPDRDQAPELCDEKTDLVITEWSLSGTNGIDSVKQIRAEEKNSHIRILMVS